MVRFSRPRSWPVAVKMSVDLLLAAVVPLALAGWLITARARRELERVSRENVQLLARVTASRLDQVVVDTRRVAQRLALDNDIVALCAAAQADRGQVLSAADRELAAVVATNPDAASAFVTDRAGVGLASTSPENVGFDLNFREYVRKALAGETYISEMLVGKTSSRPGVYFSAPVRAYAAAAGQAADGPVLGAVVVKLQGERIWALLDEVQVGAHGYALLTDEDGIILSHPRKELVYSSVGDIDPPRMRLIDPPTRFGVEAIPSLQYHELIVAPLIDDSVTGTIRYRGAEPGTPGAAGLTTDWIAGYSRLNHRPWKVSVSMPVSQFAAPMRDLEHQARLTALAVAILAAGLALWRARGIVRPVLQLTDAANKLASGDFTAHAPVHSDDEIGRLAGSFNAMVPRLREAVDLQQSVALAAEVQKSLLPAADPTPPGLDVAGRSTYCDAAGGDYFDFMDVANIPGLGTLIAVGDVMGHGIGAALLMASARAALRAEVGDVGSLALLMTKINRVLAGDSGHHQFMTLSIVVISADRRSVRWASAGHDPAIIYHPASGEFEELEGGEIPLGIMADTEYSEFHRQCLRPTDAMVIGTDGIWEMVNEAGAHFGKDRLNAVLKDTHARPAAEIAQALEAAMLAFRGRAKVKDDVTYVVVRVLETKGRGEG